MGVSLKMLFVKCEWSKTNLVQVSCSWYSSLLKLSSTSFRSFLISTNSRQFIKVIRSDGQAYQQLWLLANFSQLSLRLLKEKQDKAVHQACRRNHTVYDDSVKSKVGHALQPHQILHACIPRNALLIQTWSINRSVWVSNSHDSIYFVAYFSPDVIFLSKYRNQ